MTVDADVRRSPRRYESDPAGMAEGPRRAYETIQERRGAVAPPYLVLIESPKVALAVEQLSSLLWAGQLPIAALEAVFLVVARRLRCDEQWRRHEVKALAAGMTPEDVQAIASGLAPQGARETRTVCIIAKRLLAGQRIGRDLWTHGDQLLGRPGLADLCAFLGLASIIAMSINLIKGHESDM